MVCESARLPARRRAALGLFTVALGTAIVASSMAQAAFDPGPVAPAVNRTAEALAGYQDMTLPGAAH